MEYRREIDGLRAVAVVRVVLFHAGLKTFSGGYVGVDEFFVISGYLITTTLLTKVGEKRFSIARFYERRACRILPALFLVLAACLPFAWAWLLPADLEGFCKSLVAVCLFASNMFFNATSGYFETTTELKPLLHTWSLAVEEQFYLLYPLLLVLLSRWGGAPRHRDRPCGHRRAQLAACTVRFGRPHRLHLLFAANACVGAAGGRAWRVRVGAWRR